MSRPKKRSKFVDDEADQSGSGHDGESDGGDVATKEDMEFINDERGSGEEDPADGEGDLPDLKKIKIRKSERKLSKDDYRLILENSGIKAPSCKKRSRKKTRKEKKNIYKDSDDDGFHSGDEGFIATSSDDESSGADEAGCDMQASIKTHVQNQGAQFYSSHVAILLGPLTACLARARARAGICFKKAEAAVGVQAGQAQTLTFMEKDAFYLAVEAESGEQQAKKEGCLQHEAPQKPVPLCMRLGSASKTMETDADPPEKPAKAAKPAKPAKAAKPATKVRPMDAHTRKVAPIFLGRQQAIKDAAAAQSGSGSKKKIETGVFWNAKDGKAYIRHKNGLTTPHEL